MKKYLCIFRKGGKGNREDEKRGKLHQNYKISG